MSLPKSIVLIIIFLTLSPLAEVRAQFTFDVKTIIEEKNELQNYKQGLLSSISNSSWSRVNDVGEDYSLWLHSLERSYTKDSVTVSIIVELRTPAMFSRGNFVDNRLIWLSYNSELAREVGNEEYSNINLDSENHETYEENLQNLSSAVGLVTSVGLTDVTGFSEASISALIVELGKLMERKPSPLELMESYYIGQQALDAAWEMVTNQEN